jgi:hypothetical protein
VPSIQIDDEVWAKLQAAAEPLVDTPNTVLRRELGLDRERGLPDLTSGLAAEAPHQRAARAPVGSLLPESAYELPIMRALADRGGSAPAREIVSAVGDMVAQRLTPLDRAPLPNGGRRWESRVQFARLRMKERSLIKSGSPRGLWELSDAGAAELARREGER